MWRSRPRVTARSDDNNVDRTPFDDGLIRQERRYASAMTALSITALLESDADYGRFRAWAREYAHRWFAWTAPETGAVHRVRVRGGAGGIDYSGARRRRPPALVGGNAHARGRGAVNSIVDQEGPGRRPGRRDRAARVARSVARPRARGARSSGASARRLREVKGV